MRTRHLSLLTLATMVMLMPLVATAQDGPPPITWVNTLQVNGGEAHTLESLFDQFDKPILDKLLADGEILSWGFGYQMVGPPGVDYAMWATMPNWGTVSTVEAAFEKARKAMSKDEMKAMAEGWTAAIKDGSDRTEIIRHLVFKPNMDAPPPKYLMLSAYTVKPGMGEDATKMYKGFVGPVYDSLLESGAIGGYGLAVPAMHTQTDYSHEGWVVFGDTAALDAIDAAFMQDEADTSDGDKVARDAALESMFDTDSHYDRLIRIVATNS